MAKPLLFFIEDVSEDTIQIIVSWIIGAILPIIALMMTDMVATNIKNTNDDEVEEQPKSRSKSGTKPKTKSEPKPKRKLKYKKITIDLTELDEKIDLCFCYKILG